MGISHRFTTRDLELLPEGDGKRYEIIDGELYVSRSPDWHHPYACTQAALRLVSTLLSDDVLTSPLLPGYSCPLAKLWAPVL